MGLLEICIIKYVRGIATSVGDGAIGQPELVFDDIHSGGLDIVCHDRWRYTKPLTVRLECYQLGL